jgi:hypothetical protein
MLNTLELPASRIQTQLLRLVTIVLSRRGLAALALVLALRHAWTRSKIRHFVHEPEKCGRRIGSVPSASVEDGESEYDVIVIGGGKVFSISKHRRQYYLMLKWRLPSGTAGCVLASRLTEDPSIKVLLLEAGPRFDYSTLCTVSHKLTNHISSVAQILSRVPVAYSRLFKSKHDWNLTTTPQSGCGGRQLYWPRGECFDCCAMFPN